MNRSNFLKLLGASAFGGCCNLLNGYSPCVALQLYSIHKLFWKEPEHNLEVLKAAGYDGVEFFNYDGRTAVQLRTMLGNAGLKGAGTHVNGDVDLVGDALKRTLDFCAEAGIESITTPHASRKSAEEYRAFGYAMGKVAEAAVPYGIKVGIHTTYHHFTTRYGADTAWDMIYKDASTLLQQQVDTSNTFHTGQDVVALLAKYRGRHHSVHLKENVPTADGVFCVPPTDGGKCVPWAEIMSYMKTEPGNRWLIVEAEGRPDSLEPAIADCHILRDWL